MLPVMLVDAHTHLLPDRLARAIRGYFEQHIVRDLPYPCEATRARECLRAEGVTACWSLPYAHRAGMASGLNRWMAEAFPASDPYVVAGATVHPEDDVPRVLDEALGELRLRVLKLHCAVGGFDADDPRLDPLWKRVSESGQPVVAHIGRSALGITGVAELGPVSRVAERWPAARIVIAHCGAPAVARTLALLRRAPAVHADLTPVVRDVVPVGEGALGARVCEDEPRQVHVVAVQEPGRLHERCERARAGEYVAQPVDDHGDGRLKQVERRQQLATDLPPRRFTRVRAGACPAGDLRQVGQVSSLGSVEEQGVGQGVDDRDRRVPVPSLLDPAEVLDADPGSIRQLGTPQPWGAAPAAKRQAEVIRLQAVSFGAYEVPERRTHAIERNDDCPESF